MVNMMDSEIIQKNFSQQARVLITANIYFIAKSIKMI